ncbi:unnamed protein product [Moneuplotes crassus]|uniref:Uncharacterized protein n=1 Tax=Euplotes crassus TaxID=5936 RepID=A0AAD2D840_EUPCR|nr:unnamed protein product [Moneuplotes crassus]
MVPEDIWDCPDQVGEEECAPQMPHFTKQFENTLKDNKGSSNKADFEGVLENTNTSKIIYLRPSDELVPAGFQKQSVTCRVRKTLRDYKCKTYNVKKSSKWRGINFADSEKKLRQIPSDQILKILLN